MDVLHQNALVLEHVTLHLHSAASVRDENESRGKRARARSLPRREWRARAPSGTSRDTCACQSSWSRGTCGQACEPAFGARRKQPTRASGPGTHLRSRRRSTRMRRIQSTFVGRRASRVPLRLPASDGPQRRAAVASTALPPVRAHRCPSGGPCASPPAPSRHGSASESARGRGVRRALDRQLRTPVL